MPRPRHTRACATDVGNVFGLLEGACHEDARRDDVTGGQTIRAAETELVEFQPRRWARSLNPGVGPQDGRQDPIDRTRALLLAVVIVIANAQRLVSGSLGLRAATGWCG